MVTIDDPGRDQQIAGINRDSTAGLTAPVRLADLRRLNQQAACRRESQTGALKRRERHRIGDSPLRLST